MQAKRETPPRRICSRCHVWRSCNLIAAPSWEPSHGTLATGLKELQLREVDIIKVVENFPFISEVLVVAGMGCTGLKKVSNIPQLTMLRAELCPKLRCVDWNPSPACSSDVSSSVSQPSATARLEPVCFCNIKQLAPFYRSIDQSLNLFSVSVEQRLLK